MRAISSGSVCRFNNFEKLIGSIVFQALDFVGSVVECQPLFPAKGFYQRLIKTLLARYGEMVFVLKEQQPHHPPEIVVPVWVIERH